MSNVKKSYGTICCRTSKENGVEILMIKKATTYQFCEFVAGKYGRLHNKYGKNYDEGHLIKLFNNMTYHEKIDILSLKFDTMWYRIFKKDPMQYLPNEIEWRRNYIRQKGIFDNTFIFPDEGKKLRKLIAQTKNIDTSWEIPKGRKDNLRERSYNTAIREFEEETSIKSNRYRILWHIKPYIISHTEKNATYRNEFIFAEAIGQWEPIYRFDNCYLLNEVSQIAWMSLNSIKNLCMEDKAKERLIKNFKKIVKIYKKNSNNKLIKTLVEY